MGWGGVGAVPGQVLLSLRPRDGAGSRVRGPGSRLAGSRVLGRPVPRPGSRARLAEMPSPTGPVPSARLRPPAPAARAHLRCPGRRRRRRRHWTRPPRPGPLRPLGMGRPPPNQDARPALPASAPEVGAVEAGVRLRSASPQAALSCCALGPGDRGPVRRRRTRRPVSAEVTGLGARGRMPEIRVTPLGE